MAPAAPIPLSAGGGNDTISYYGAETSIDGGTGTNTLILRAATTVNLANSDQTSGDSVTVTGFQNVDASAVSATLSITGSSSANTITGGSGDDTIDGSGGADVINAGGGNDTVTYNGSETSIDGGAGSDTLILSASATVTAVNFTVSSGVDQTTGDTTSVANFENLNAGALSSAITVTGLSSANAITTGSGNDTIDGGGGADVISAGGGNDFVSYYGNETSIDGGTGSNTLVMRAAGTVNLGNADQTSSDTANVTNFQNIDASALSSVTSLTGSSGANTITGGSGNDTIDGAGGADTITAGGGNDTVTYRGGETSIDGGTGSDTLVLAAGGGTTAVNFSVSAGSDQTVGDSVSVVNFESLDASLVGSALTVTGSSAANTITTGSGADTIDGGGGADAINAGGGNDTVTYRGTETSIDGGTGTNTLVMNAAATVNLANGDQTSGDATTVSNFQNVNASGLATALSITGSSADNIITGGSGNDTIDGGGGADTISAGGGNDSVTYRGTETLDRWRYRHQHAGDECGCDRQSRQCRPDVGRQHYSQQFPECRCLSIVGSGNADGLFVCQHDHWRLGQRYDRRRGRGGYNQRRWRQRHRDLSRHGKRGRRRLRQRHARSCRGRVESRPSISRWPPAPTRPPATAPASRISRTSTRRS